MSELKDKLLEVLNHPVLRLVVSKAVEKAVKKGAQAVIAAVVVLAAQGNPSLDSVQAQVVLLGVVMGLLEVVRTTVKAGLQGRYPSVASLL